MSEPKYVPLDDATAEAAATGDYIREAVGRLAAMDEVDYIACRKNEARDLGMNVSELNRMIRDARKACGDAGHGLKVEPPEPWLKAVEGVELLDAIERALLTYLVLPKHAAPTIALWILHTHLFPFDVWDVSPRLAVLAPERGCGKT